MPTICAVCVVKGRVLALSKYLYEKGGAVLNWLPTLKLQTLVTTRFGAANKKKKGSLYVLAILAIKRMVESYVDYLIFQISNFDYDYVSVLYCCTQVMV